MKNNKQNRGITLIALIITIIVMIILVAVSVSVALQGGIFDKAGNAATGTEERAIYEEIVSAMEIDNNGNIVVEGEDGTVAKAIAMLEAEGKEASFAEGILTVKGKQGTYYYTITDKEIKIVTVGTIPGGDDEPEVDPDLYEYLIGDENTKGTKNFMSLLDPGTYTFIADENLPSFTGYSNIKLDCMGEEEEETVWMYIRYGRDTYRFSVDEEYNTLDLELYNEATGNLGKYVTYGEKNLEYIVIGENPTAGTVDLITADALGLEDGGITLGVDGDFTSSLAMYNNSVVSTLIDACKTATGLEKGGNIISIRSVGGPEEESTLADAPKFTAEGWSATKFGDSTFRAGDNDNNPPEDYEKMKKVGIRIADNTFLDFVEGYWLASRYVKAYSDGVNFGVYSVRSAGYLDGTRFVQCFKRGWS